MIRKFYNSEETLYGKDAISLNMHLRNHLEVVILDHGPVTAFRVLALNDLMNSMGSERTNKRPVELQILKEFSSARFQKDMKMSLKKEFQGDFL